MKPVLPGRSIWLTEGPFVPLFLKLTAVVAVGIVVLVLLAMLLKVLVIAALIAAVIIGVLAVRRLFVRRRSGAVTIVQRRW
ncbi:MAG TPA: hypothetical protein VGN14_09050 [Candidatus Elarobacter sp.]